MDYIKEIKEIVAEQAYEQLKHNLHNVDTKELGEAIDIVKDMAEASYYCAVVEGMEKAEKERQEKGETVYYTERYLPYYIDNDKIRRYADRRNSPASQNPIDYSDYYNRNMYMNRNNYEMGNNNRQMNNDNMANNDNVSNSSNRYYRMPYYDYNEPVARDLREGRSPRSRRMYMEGKELHKPKESQIHELETYMSELSQDVTEMIMGATPEEKQMLVKKLSLLTNKIENMDVNQNM